MSDRIAAYLANVQQTIAEHGWMLQTVFPTEDAPGVEFAYTVGLTPAGLPELVVSGLPGETAGAILNNAAAVHLRDELRPGTVTGDDVGNVAFRVVAAPYARVGTATRLYGSNRVRAVQLIWPDKAGAYPGDPGWTLGDAQPVYDVPDVS